MLLGDMYKTGDHNSLPFLTTEFDGVGGVIKACEEDFFVEELPLYDFSDKGKHVYALIEKKGIATMEALGQIATALKISRQDIGYAGLKDACAVARQWISVEDIDAKQLLLLDIDRIKVIKLARHSNKIKLGHLAGNRFVVRLRDLKSPPKDLVKTIERVMAILMSKGVPNYFGLQRFGYRKDTGLLGEALVRGKIDAFIDMFLGQPKREDVPAVRAARTFYQKGNYKKAREAWPFPFADQRRALKVLIQNKGNKKNAYNAVNKHLKKFFVYAYQSALFNRVLAARIPDIDKLLAGDVASKTINGSCFRVEDAALEQARCDSFEISPTGPLFGPGMTGLTGPAGEIENPVLEQAGLKEKDLRQMRQYGAKGGRRALRFQPRHCHVAAGRDRSGPYIELRFELDSGCYATSLIREICKTNV